MDSFMKRAVELAVQNVNEGGQPFGAVLVKDNLIVSEGVNELHKKHDVSGHAELLAIRRAQEKFETNELSGYTMYASGEPCSMCLTAMYFAGIDKLYYCQSTEDAAAVGLGKSTFIYHELKKNRDDRTLQMTQMTLVEGQDDPMKVWKQKQ
ncbi:nucleoside deaminase [Bacillus timonensis]|uniref:Nucleoside deaminase n=1 Tax=Bacillus timonensis TaxID=1033734 RepID=A0A4S3PMF3_9BACI|nr:nucleoside deaminase [Bacillus timonensis]THE10700.1 nucleoside deaminase [Bacillus timonensis]